ncbi:TetR/AcrR family transcriptional regulator [Solihabitans fulvus]|uniref:TetR/AcrR family transcriptional regulator n=1 Tax=Solihabitans fulvus TaxID=1892852 RepID=A0A5B2WUI3_9PSEU|nr:TetR/AcrR family transcriptional regulator [Solihabitans fulvus]KAA2254079.1 TetR/AcrR family transcriptional regulator [Solihabitans fulvus]
MPVKRGEPLSPENTRARILAVAALAFYERGVHAVGVNEIAELAGSSKLTIYRYFESKDGLVEAVLRQRSERIHDWLERGVEAVPPGADRVLALFDLLADWYRQAGFHGCAMVNAAADTRGDGVAVLGLTRGHLARYRVLLERCLLEAGVAEPSAPARQLLILIEGATVVSSIDADDTAGPDARRLAELVLASVVPSAHDLH